MSRREIREQIFKMLFQMEFHSEEELEEQFQLVMEELEETDGEYVSGESSESRTASRR